MVTLEELKNNDFDEKLAKKIAKMTEDNYIRKIRGLSAQERLYIANRFVKREADLELITKDISKDKKLANQVYKDMKENVNTLYRGYSTIVVNSLPKEARQKILNTAIDQIQKVPHDPETFSRLVIDTCATEDGFEVFKDFNDRIPEDKKEARNYIAGMFMTIASEKEEIDYILKNNTLEDVAQYLKLDALSEVLECEVLSVEQKKEILVYSKLYDKYHQLRFSQIPQDLRDSILSDYHPSAYKTLDEYSIDYPSLSDEVLSKMINQYDVLKELNVDKLMNECKSRNIKINYDLYAKAMVDIRNVHRINNEVYSNISPDVKTEILNGMSHATLYELRKENLHDQELNNIFEKKLIEECNKAICDIGYKEAFKDIYADPTIGEDIKERIYNSVSYEYKIELLAKESVPSREKRLELLRNLDAYPETGVYASINLTEGITNEELLEVLNSTSIEKVMKVIDDGKISDERLPFIADYYIKKGERFISKFNMKLLNNQISQNREDKEFIEKLVKNSSPDQFARLYEESPLNEMYDKYFLEKIPHTSPENPMFYKKIGKVVSKLNDMLDQNKSLKDGSIGPELDEYLKGLRIDQKYLIVQNIQGITDLKLKVYESIKNHEYKKNEFELYNKQNYNARFNFEEYFARLSKEEMQLLGENVKSVDIMQMIDPYRVGGDERGIVTVPITLMQERNEYELLASCSPKLMQRYIQGLMPNEFEEFSNSVEKYLTERISNGDEKALLKAIDNDINSQINITRILKEGYYTGKNKETIDYMLSKNRYAFRDIDSRIFSEDFNMYSPEFKERLIRYPEYVNNLIEGLDDGRTKNFNNMYNIISEGNDPKTVSEIAGNILESTFSNRATDQLMSLDGLNLEQVDTLKEYYLRRYGLGNNNEITSLRIPKINTKNDIDNFYNKINEMADESFEKAMTYEEKLDSFCNRHLSMTSIEAKDFLNAYDIGIRKCVDEGNFEQNKEKILFMDTLRSLVNVGDSHELSEEEKMESINKMYKLLDGNEKPIVSRENLLVIGNECKRTIAKELSESLYKVDEKDRMEDLVYNDTKIPTYELKDDFKMLVHSIGAYGNFNMKSGNYKSSWNDSEKTANHGICCSLISDQLLAHAHVDNVLLGFDGFGEMALNAEAPADMYSHNAQMSTSSNGKQKFLPSDELINSTRTHYNEVVIERQEMRKEVDSEYPNIQPSYVIIGGKTTEEELQRAMKCASDFNIPIIKIDRAKYAKRNAKMFNDLKAEFLQDGDIKKLEKIINMAQSNSCAGLGSTFYPRDFIHYLEREAIPKINSSGDRDKILSDLSEFKKYAQIEKAKNIYCDRGIAALMAKDCLQYEIDKNIQYYCKEGVMLDDIVKNNPEIEITEDEIKTLNLIKKNALSYNKEKKFSIEEINSFEKKALFSIRQAKDLDIDERYEVYKIQELELLSVEEKMKILNNKKARKSTKYRVIESLYSQVSPEELKKYLQDYENRDYYYMNDNGKYANIVNNSRIIERGDIYETNISAKDKEELRSFRNNIEKEYFKIEEKAREVEINGQEEREIVESTETI